MRNHFIALLSVRPQQAIARRVRDREAVAPWADSMDFDAVTSRDRWFNADDTVERAMAQMDDTSSETSTAEH